MTSLLLSIPANRRESRTMTPLVPSGIKTQLTVVMARIIFLSWSALGRLKSMTLKALFPLLTQCCRLLIFPLGLSPTIGQVGPWTSLHRWHRPIPRLLPPTIPLTLSLCTRVTSRRGEL